MPRHRKPPAAQSPEDRHAAYAALTARLAGFQAEISTQARSRATLEVPAATQDMAADLIAQMARLMGDAVEARGLPRLAGDRPVGFSELSAAFTQIHFAFTAFGKRCGFDKPVADAEAGKRAEDARAELARRINARIAYGIEGAYLVPTGGAYDAEKRELAMQFTAIVNRIREVEKAEGMPPSG